MEQATRSKTLSSDLPSEWHDPAYVWVSLKEAAKILRLSEITLARWLKNGKVREYGLLHVRIGLFHYFGFKKPS